MKVTYNWLKDFVDIRIPAQKLAEKLTMAGLEVNSLEKKAGDFVLELEITPNRPDCLSVIGIAREAAAITGKKLKVGSRFSVLGSRLSGEHRKTKTEPRNLKIIVENKKDCPLYTAKIIKDITVKPSPDWLKKRLELIGLRSINNIVDITNYLLMETGEPMHAFDLDRLVSPLARQPVSQSKIIVRRAKKGEEIITIDGIKRNLDENILIIASSFTGGTSRPVDRKTGRPVAIAGIMGGRDSEVSRQTKNILLEAAVFDPITTRRASRRLGLSSESSYRFERGVDWQNVEFASIRAVNLFLNLAGGKLILSKYTAKPKTKKKIIILKTEEVNRILGRDFSSTQIKKILTSLCLSVKQRGKDLKVGAPSFRIDVNQPVDLIEEIARISGYENIPARLPKIIPQDTTVYSEWKKRREIKDILVSQGLSEVITYSLIGKNLARQFGYSDSQLVIITNPLTNQQEALCPSLIPGLVSCVGYNLNQKQKSTLIFEIGNIFWANKEQPSLGLACSGKEFNLLHIKGILELLLERLGIVDFEFLRDQYEHPYLLKGTSLSLIINPAPSYSTSKPLSRRGGVNKKCCANSGMIKPDILERLDIKDFVFVAELDLKLLFAKMDKVQKRYIPIPLYPEVMRDISIMLRQEIPVGDVIKKIKIKNIHYLVELNLKDHYLGKQISPGYRGLTLSCIYRASDHTLTAQEIESAHQKVLDILKTEFSAQQR